MVDAREIPVLGAMVALFEAMAMFWNLKGPTHKPQTTSWK